jgi:hypothetical protein
MELRSDQFPALILKRAIVKLLSLAAGAQGVAQYLQSGNQASHGSMQRVSWRAAFKRMQGNLLQPGDY